MKFLVVLLALVALVAAEEEWKPITTIESYLLIHTECAQESGVTPEQAAKMSVFEYPDEEEVREYILCAGMKSGVFDEESFYLDRLAQAFKVVYADTDKIEDILLDCMGDNAEDNTADVWAYRGFQCIINSEVGAAFKYAIQADREKRAMNSAAVAADDPEM